MPLPGHAMRTGAQDEDGGTGKIKLSGDKYTKNLKKLLTKEKICVTIYLPLLESFFVMPKNRHAEGSIFEGGKTHIFTGRCTE